MPHAVVLLGSNINPVQNTRKAVRLLRALFNVAAVSTAWETPAVGTSGPNFINVAILIDTSASPAQLKSDCLRRMENRLGRVRSADKNAPRTVDLDVIVYDLQVLDTDLWRQAHIAMPVSELLPDLIEPQSSRHLTEIAQDLSQSTSVLARPEVLSSLG